MGGCSSCKHMKVASDAFPCNECSNNYINQYEQRSHGDMIRMMDDDQLAAFLSHSAWHGVDEEIIKKWLKKTEGD